MIIKYNLEVSENPIKEMLLKLTNQIFKLLPMREEGLDWETPLQNLKYDLVGIQKLLSNKEETESLFFSILCKMEVLSTLKEEEDFFLFRTKIFECLNLVGELGKCLI